MLKAGFKKNSAPQGIRAKKETFVSGKAGLSKIDYTDYLAKILKNQIKLTSNMVAAELNQQTAQEIRILENSTPDDIVTLDPGEFVEHRPDCGIVYCGRGIKLSFPLDQAASKNLSTIYFEDTQKLKTRVGMTPKFSATAIQQALLADLEDTQDEPNIVENFYDGDLYDLALCAEKIFPARQSTDSFISKQVKALMQQHTPSEILEKLNEFHKKIKRDDEMPTSMRFRYGLLRRLTIKVKEFHSLQSKVSAWSL